MPTFFTAIRRGGALEYLELNLLYTSYAREGPELDTYIDSNFSHFFMVFRSACLLTLARIQGVLGIFLEHLGS